MPSRLTITYVGTLSESYPAGALIKALKAFHDDGNDFLIRFAGTVPDNIKQNMLRELPQSNIEFISYVSHEQAVEYMLGSSILILIIPQHRSNKSIITGKLFEYLASGKYIICLGPVDGDAAAIIREAQAGQTVSYDNVEKLKEILSDQSFDTTPSTKILTYSRSMLTKKLASYLD